MADPPHDLGEQGGATRPEGAKVGADDPRRRLEADWLHDDALQAVFACLERAGGEVRAVGGCVRDGLLARPVHDVDLATTLKPRAVMAAARASGLSAVATGIDHGTVTLVSARRAFEVTTLRRDVETDGRHAKVAFTTDWASDARRRDFTMNALYAAADGTVHDPLGGLSDLEAARVVFIGDARERLHEDVLRLLRFFRFSASHGRGAIDPDGLAACNDMRAGLRRLSAERVRSELLKLLVAPSVLPVVRTMFDHGYWPGLLGAVPDVGRFARLIAREATTDVPADAPLRLGALAVLTRDEHAALQARLRLSNAAIAALASARWDDRPPFSGNVSPGRAPSPRDVKRLVYRVGNADAMRALLAAWAKAQAAGDDEANATTGTGAQDHHAALTLARAWTSPAFPITGADVIDAGVPPGREVGAVLAALETTWLDEDFEPDRTALLARMPALIATLDATGGSETAKQQP
ncbi:MAG: CCA tRNA nucleotidyltransferase [Pseudomonadota bacterium]